MRRSENQAIQTELWGYRCRSRLEARWLVYLDALHITFDFEPEGYELKSGKYLPDLWLPQVSLFAEIKPDRPTMGELNRACDLVRTTKQGLIFLIGIPDLYSYPVVQYAENALPDMNGVHFTDAMVAMYHGYPVNEHRFYSSTGWEHPTEIDRYIVPQDQRKLWNDEVGFAIEAARSARFEHGESPVRRSA